MEIKVNIVINTKHTEDKQGNIKSSSQSIKASKPTEASSKGVDNKAINETNKSVEKITQSIQNAAKAITDSTNNIVQNNKSATVAAKSTNRSNSHTQDIKKIIDSGQRINPPARAYGSQQLPFTSSSSVIPNRQIFSMITREGKFIAAPTYSDKNRITKSSRFTSTSFSSYPTIPQNRPENITQVKTSSVKPYTSENIFVQKPLKASLRPYTPVEVIPPKQQGPNVLQPLHTINQSKSFIQRPTNVLRPIASMNYSPNELYNKPTANKPQDLFGLKTGGGYYSSNFNYLYNRGLTEKETQRLEKSSKFEPSIPFDRIKPSPSFTNRLFGRFQTEPTFSRGGFGGSGGGGGDDGGNKPPKRSWREWGEQNKGFGPTLFKEMGSTTASLLKFTAAGALVGSVFGSFAKGVRTIIDVNSQLTELNRVLATNKSTLDSLKNSAISTGIEFGQSTSEVLKGYNVFAQQGLSVPEIKQRSRVVTLGSNVSTLGQQDLSETMTAFLKAYPELEKAPIRLIDSFAAVEDANAVVAKDLADAGKKVAVAARNAGISFDQLNAITTVIQEATRAGGAQIGTAERRIFLNMNTDKTANLLKTVGIDTRDQEGNFKGTFDILQQIADIYPTLTDAKKRDIATTIAETRFTNQFLALMENFPKVNKIVTQSQNSSGYATEKNAIQMSSIVKQSASLGTAFEGLALSISDGLVSPLTDGLKVANGLIQALTSLSNINIPGLGSATSLLDTVSGAKSTEEKGQGVNLGSAAVLSAEIILTVKAFQMLAATTISILGPIKTVGTGLVAALSGIATTAVSSLAAWGAIGGILLAGSLALYGFNRALESAQDRLTRTGITGEKSRSSASLANLSELESTIVTLSKRQQSITGKTSKEEIDSLLSKQKETSESLRKTIVQIPEKSLKSIKDLNIDSLNNIKFENKTLDELVTSSDSSGINKLINTLKELESQALSSANAVSEGVKTQKSFTTGLGSIFGYKYSGGQQLQQALEKPTLENKEAIREFKTRYQMVTENIGNLTSSFRTGNLKDKDLKTFLDELSGSNKIDLIKQVSLISNPSNSNNVITELNKEFGSRYGKFGYGKGGVSDALTNIFKNQLQTAEQTIRESELTKLGKYNPETGQILGEKIQTTDQLKLSKVLSSPEIQAAGGTALIQTFDQAGKAIQKFTLDTDKSGQLILKSATTDIYKGIDIIKGKDSIVNKLKEAGSVLVEAASTIAAELEGKVKTVLYGFGTGRSVDVSKPLKEGAKSLKDYSDTAAAGYKVTSDGIVTFNQQLQQFGIYLAEIQDTAGQNDEDRLKQQQIGILASTINSIGRTNKAFEALATNLESIDIKNKLDEKFTPSAIDATRAFGGRQLAMTLGKTFNELTPQEQAINKSPTLFGKIEELQTFKSQLKSTAGELDTTKASLKRVLGSTSEDILKTINTEPIKNLMQSNAPGLEDAKNKMSELYTASTLGSPQKKVDEIINELLSLIPDSSIYDGIVDKINKDLKPLEEAAKTAIALQQLSTNAKQVADTFNTQGKMSGFFKALKEGVGGGLNAIAGSNAPTIFTEDATGRRVQRGIMGTTNLQMQQEVNRLLSSSDVRSGAIKVFDETGKRLEAITEEEARNRNKVLDVQSRKERKQVGEELRNTRVNEYISALNNQYNTIVQLLNQGGINAKGVTGLKSIQTSIELEAQRPARNFIGPRGDLLSGSMGLLSSLPQRLSSIFSSKDLTEMLKSSSDETLNLLSRGGSKEAQDILKERDAEKLASLTEPAKNIESNTSQMVNILSSILGYFSGNKPTPTGGESGSNIIDNSIKYLKSGAKSLLEPYVSKINEQNQYVDNIKNWDKNDNKALKEVQNAPTNASKTKSKIITDLASAKEEYDVPTVQLPIITDLESAKSNVKQYNINLDKLKTNNNITGNNILDGLMMPASAGISSGLTEGLLNLLGLGNTNETANFINKPETLTAGIAATGTLGALSLRPYNKDIRNIIKDSGLSYEKANSILSTQQNLQSLLEEPDGVARQIARTQGTLYKAPNIETVLKNTGLYDKIPKVINQGAAYEDYLKKAGDITQERSLSMKPFAEAIKEPFVTNITIKNPGGLTTPNPELINSNIIKPTTMLGTGLKYASNILSTLGAIDAPVDAFNSAGAIGTGLIAPAFSNDTFRSLSNTFLGTNVPEPKSEADKYALQVASNMTNTDALRTQLTSYTPTSYLLESMGLSSARDSGIFKGLMGGENYVKSLDISNQEDIKNLGALYNEEKTMNPDNTYSKVFNMDKQLSGSDNTTKELKNINENLQQSKGTESTAGLEVTNVSDISFAVKDGLEKASANFSEGFKESFSELKSSFSSLIEALNSTSNKSSTTGAQMTNIETRIQALLEPALDTVLEKANEIKIMSDQKVEELSKTIKDIEIKHNEKVENIKNELNLQVKNDIDGLHNKTDLVKQEVSSMKSDLQNTSNDSKMALSLAGIIQQKADQIETQVNSVQARVTHASLNYNGY